MKSSSRCLRLIGSAIMLSSTGVLATQSADRSPNSVLDSVGSSDSMLGSYSFTTDDDGCRPELYADGICHRFNNVEECEYDGGDCCECTCNDNNDGRCGFGIGIGYHCVDPAAPCVDDDDVTDINAANCDVEGTGDGLCDLRNNNASCDYDGGDCCPCTCERPPPASMSSPNASSFYCKEFACIDPDAACVDDDAVTVDMIDFCQSPAVGNGECDEENNIPECDYDGGDCCECTCEAGTTDKADTTDEAGATDEAGTSNEDDFVTPVIPCTNFVCIDPDAPCVDSDAVEKAKHCENVLGIGNGYCDVGNNNALCDYDGGDCCPCTCERPPEGNSSWLCIMFACIDPDAACVDDDAVTVDMIDFCDARFVGNGDCDEQNNIPECDYDGGDCCECTCEAGTTNDNKVSGLADDCANFVCIDPDAPCVDADAVEKAKH